ncbi:hypothetical protein [Streptomyces sp. CBMA152]|uniref:hypothetical protein n=1 Tax=Streptomyces sp. CBMA152 TaxID=1896312 RepID=UPI001661570A|nr:hypothetical protein [Streptomyces sp. CBMA152]MBD0742822.1 hypothetical protein [Streptomyces sp. CBMA152]
MTEARAADATEPTGGSAAVGRTPFDDLYEQPDPRTYFRVLGALDYRTPHHAQEVFRRLAAARSTQLAESAAVLDICCSYGINAALLNHDLTWDDLYTHYTSPQAKALSTTELIAWDRTYYAARRRHDAVPVTGLDVSAPALDYALAVGLLNEAYAENLETAPPSPALRRAARDIRLITVTGGASFLSPRTFRPLLTAADAPVWVAAFVLRTGSYHPIAAGLLSHGLVTEKATGTTFPQRRFTSAQEQQYAVDAVTAAGEDPRGRETDGYFHTALHLSRPPEDAEAFPLTALS